MTRRTESRVTTVPPMMRRSTFSFVGAWALAREVHAESKSAAASDFESRFAMDRLICFTGAPEFRKGAQYCKRRKIGRSGNRGEDGVLIGKGEWWLRGNAAAGRGKPRPYNGRRCLSEAGRIEGFGE